MRNYFILATIIFFACSCASQFSEPVQQLMVDWQEANASVQGLCGKITEEHKELTLFIDHLLVHIGYTTKIGENYLNESDQLRSKLMGYKSAFDALNEDVRNFSLGWEEKGDLVDQLQEGLMKGKLPGNISDLVRQLNVFLIQSKKQLAAWEKEMNEIKNQCQRMGASIKQ